MTKIYYFIYILLIGLNLILLNANRSYSKKYNIIEAKIGTISESLMTSVFPIKDALIDLELKDLKSGNVKTPISSISLSGKKLVLYFTEEICESCFISILNILNKEEFKSISDNMIIIASFDRFNSFKLFMSNYERNIKAYCIENEIVKLSKKDIHNPCFFMLDENLEINNLFVNIKNYESLTELYLKNILEQKRFENSK